jgi:hypothetical protein
MELPPSCHTTEKENQDFPLFVFKRAGTIGWNEKAND